MKTVAVGTQFWLWKVLDILITKERQHWKVQCDCGKIRTVRASNIYNGRSRSCGSLECVRKVQELHNQDFSLPEEYPVNIGDKFRKLTVVNSADPTINGKKRFVVKCDCGRTSVETAYDLFTGRRGSCGNARFNLEIGQKFGELTVSSIDPINPTIITTTCSCGAVETYKRKQLTSRQIKTCLKERRRRCLTVINEGDVFGKLTITSQIFDYKTDGHRYFNCRCECGKYCIKRADGLLRGATTHCGCSRRREDIPKPSRVIANPHRAAAARKSHSAHRMNAEIKELAAEAKERELALAKAPKISDHIDKPINSVFAFLVQTTKG